MAKFEIISMSHTLLCDFCGSAFDERASVWEDKGKLACQNCAEEMK